MTKPKAWTEQDAERLKRRNTRQKRDCERRLLMRRHAAADGLDPLSLEATSPLTVVWLKA